MHATSFSELPKNVGNGHFWTALDIKKNLLFCFRSWRNPAIQNAKNKRNGQKSWQKSETYLIPDWPSPKWPGSWYQNFCPKIQKVNRTNPNLDISQFFQADSYSKNIISLYGSFSICFTPLSSSDNLIHSKIKVKGRFEINLYKLLFGWYIMTWSKDRYCQIRFYRTHFNLKSLEKSLFLK